MNRYFCELNDGKICDNCGECEMCDLNPEKICDNCGKCIEPEGDYETVKIDDVLLNTEGPEKSK